jgi:hypothetical protein
MHAGIERNATSSWVVRETRPLQLSPFIFIHKLFALSFVVIGERKISLRHIYYSMMNPIGAGPGR